MTDKDRLQTLETAAERKADRPGSSYHVGFRDGVKAAIAACDLVFTFGDVGYLRVASTGGSDPEALRAMLQSVCKVPVSLKVETPSRFTPQAPGEVEKMRCALEKAAWKFRQYEDLHAAKGTIDADLKARANAEWAEMCEEALRP